MYHAKIMQPSHETVLFCLPTYTCTYLIPIFGIGNVLRLWFNSVSIQSYLLNATGTACACCDWPGLSFVTGSISKNLLVLVQCATLTIKL